MLGLATLALLGLKEAGALMLPAAACLWLAAGHPPIAGVLALSAALALWLAATRLLLGRKAWAVLGAAKAGHGTPYTVSHQRGDWHRLVVDLVMVSPLPVLWLASGHNHAAWLTVAAVAIVAAHALAPVRNVRTVLAADLVTRGLFGCSMAAIHPALVPAVLLPDALAIWRLRNSYDPVTATLTAAFGMTSRT